MGAERDAITEARAGARCSCGGRALRPRRQRRRGGRARRGNSARGAWRRSPRSAARARAPIASGPSVRAQAAWTMGTLGTSTAVPELAALLHRGADEAINAAGRHRTDRRADQRACRSRCTSAALSPTLARSYARAPLPVCPSGVPDAATAPLSGERSPKTRASRFAPRLRGPSDASRSANRTGAPSRDVPRTIARGRRRPLPYADDRTEEDAPPDGLRRPGPRQRAAAGRGVPSVPGGRFAPCRDGRPARRGLRSGRSPRESLTLRRAAER